MSAVTDPGIRFEGVTQLYPGASLPAVSDLDWLVEEGSFNLVAGTSGSGKSTALRCVNGLVPHFSGGRFGGRVIVRGVDTRLEQPRSLSRHVGFVSQEPESQMLAGTVEDEIAFGMEQMGVAPATMRKRVEEVLDLLSLVHLRHRDTATLSGGERQRVAIGAALAMQPGVLVLDEPTSQLDPAAAEEVLTAVRRLNEDLGMTVVMSEHRLERLVADVDQIRVMESGRVTLAGDPAAVMRQCPLGMAPPVVRLARHRNWEPLPLSVREARRLKLIAPLPPLAPDGSPAVGDCVLTVRDLAAGYGQDDILRQLSFSLHQGELVALMGRNGSGKTTLLRTLMGLQPVRGGSIEFGGAAISSRQRVSDLAKRIGFLPQRAQTLLFAERVRDEIAFTARYRGLDHSEVDTIAGQWGLLDLMDRHPRDLSSGEQERVALASVLAGDPPLLLLDEPTRGMDYQRKADLVARLQELRLRGVTVLMATHDVEMVAALATRVLLLGDGEIVADGSPREVLSGSMIFSTQLNRLYGDQYLTVEDVLRSLRLGADMAGNSTDNDPGGIAG